MTDRKGYPDGIVRYPVSVARQPEAETGGASQQDVEALKEWKEQQTAVTPDGVVKGLKEIENFLANTSDGQTLAQLLSALTTSMQNEIAKKVNKSELADVATSGSYDDLSEKPDIPTVPKNVSAFTNDAGYLTKHQDLSEIKEGINKNSSDIAIEQEVSAALTEILMMALTYGYEEATETDSPEFTKVVTDQESKILMAQRVDGNIIIMGKEYKL